MNVYLAGAISGLSYDGAVDWRERAAETFRLEGIAAYSPMRAKEALKGIDDLSAWDYPDSGPLSGHAMVQRDLHDVRRADVVLANLVGAKKVSIGTVFEIGYARALRIPVIVAMESDNVHRHIFITLGADLVCPDLDAAIDWICDVLHLGGDR